MTESVIHCGDCLEVMRGLPEASFSAVVTDPPYALEFMGKGWDQVLPSVDVWAECLRLLKPGGVLLAFGGTRTFHRLTCAIEDAGFEIRDCLSWLYGSGFPKGHRFNRTPTFCQCDVSGRSGECIAPSQSQERRSGTEAAAFGDGPLSADARRSTDTGQGSMAGCPQGHGSGDGPPRLFVDDGRACAPSPSGAQGRNHSPSHDDGPASEQGCSPSPAQRTDHHASTDSSSPSENDPLPRTRGSNTRAGTSESATSTAGTDQGPSYGTGLPRCRKCGKPKGDQWKGYNVCLKPAWEPIVLAMKPLDGTFARNAQRHGVAGLNVDGGRVGGRFPANLLLDEAAAQALDEQSGELTSGKAPASGFVRNSDKHRNAYGAFEGHRVEPTFLYGDSGGASRFFYTAKAANSERHAESEVRNTHPTVKPLGLMQYLVRLVKMPEGTRILDPFAGSGSTLIAALREGVEVVGIEREEEYVEIARQRIVADAPLFNACEVV